ncbi:MAG: hypothetical protein WD228_09840 [Mycobacterium sp.]
MLPIATAGSAATGGRTAAGRRVRVARVARAGAPIGGAVAVTGVSDGADATKTEGRLPGSVTVATAAVLAGV